MRNIFQFFVILFLLGITIQGFSQNANKPHSIRVTGGVQDSYGPYKRSGAPLGLGNTDNLDVAFQMQYMAYYNEFLDFGINLTATDTKHLYDDSFNSIGGQYINNGSALDLDFISRYKFNNGSDFKENSLIKPYIYTGLSGSYISALPTKRDVDNGFGANVPLGIGFKIGKGDRVNFDLNGALRIGLFNKIPTRWEYQTGFAFNFGQPKNQPVIELPVVVPPPRDTDGDGIIDVEDDCPNEPGVPELNGCPRPVDTDGDGINDEDDECPTVAGVPELNGCPQPVDTDGDGINDEEDACPTVPGVPELNGCPRPADSDGDGIIDENDNCPTTPGVAQYQGCPPPPPPPVTPPTHVVEQLNFIARSVFFKFDSDELQYESKAKLDEIASIMRDYPNANFIVEGHTDSVGNADYNKKLSAKRAQSVVNYLVSKGIGADHLSSIGYGEEQPIASNDTEEGRQSNRRVVISLKQ